ncbi:MAG: GDSL-type esterase/lipase family protein, partial [Chloroflexota bacterium]
MDDEATASGLRAETERRLPDAPGSRPCAVVLGDSIVYGWGAAYAESYPARLEAMLRAREGDDWRVDNAGLPGETALMGADRYSRHVAPFRPRVVVIAYGLNDGALARSAFDAQREWLWRARRWPMLRWGYAAKRLLAGLGIWRRISRLAAGRAAWGHTRPRVSPPLFARALRGLVRRAQREGARVLLVGLAPLTAEAAAYTRPCLGESQWESYARCEEAIARVA